MWKSEKPRINLGRTEGNKEKNEEEKGAITRWVKRPRPIHAFTKLSMKVEVKNHSSTKGRGKTTANICRCGCGGD
jgi:hypothetical protein